MPGQQAFAGLSRRSGGFFAKPEATEGGVYIVGLDTPHKRGEHPLWDERAFLAPTVDEIVAVIGAGEDMAPIDVFKDAGRPMVGDGRQRVLAARAANALLMKGAVIPEGFPADVLAAFRKRGPLSIPIQYRTGDPLAQHSLMIERNTHRKDFTTMQAARLLADHINLYDKGPGNLERAARLFAVSLQSVANWRVLVCLHPVVQAAVDDGRISATNAMRLKECPHERQPEALAELLGAGGKRVSEAHATAAAKARAEGGAKPRPTIIPPGKRDVKRLLVIAQTRADAMPPAFALALRYFAGEITAEEAGVARLLAEKTRKGKRK